MDRRKETMCLLAALLMPAANGNVKNALNLAQGLVEEADKRWPDQKEPVDNEFEYKLAQAAREREEHILNKHAASEPAAQTPATPEGGQQ